MAWRGGGRGPRRGAPTPAPPGKIRQLRGPAPRPHPPVPPHWERERPPVKGGVSAPPKAPGRSRGLRLEVPSDPAARAGVRRAVGAFAAGAGFDSKAVGEVGLCVNEAMANVIRHAYRGTGSRPIRVTADYGRAVID